MSYPFKAFPISNSKPRRLVVKLAWMCGLALLSVGTVSARDRVHGHVDVTIGIPNVQITLGKTWETGHRNCGRTEHVVYDEKDDYVLERREIVIDEPDCHHNEYNKVVVYRNHPRCDRDVRLIRYDEPDCQHNEYGQVVVYRNHTRCDRDVRVIRHAEPVRYERDVRIIRENVPVRHNHGSRVVEVVRDRHPVERVTVIRRPEHRQVIVTDRGHSRHDGSDRKVIVTHRDNGNREYGKDHGNNGRSHDNNGNGGDKVKKNHTDNGRHNGENYVHSGHSSRRDENDRPSKRVSRERGQSGRSL